MMRVNFGEQKRGSGKRKRWIRGEWYDSDSAPVVREDDNHDIRSIATGVDLSEISEAEQRYGHLGVRYDRKTGMAIYRDRQAKLRVLKAMSMHDRDEVRG